LIPGTWVTLGPCSVFANQPRSTKSLMLRVMGPEDVHRRGFAHASRLSQSSSICETFYRRLLLWAILRVRDLCEQVRHTRRSARLASHFFSRCGSLNSAHSRPPDLQEWH
jgi:hypothetical protein